MKKSVKGMYTIKYSCGHTATSSAYTNGLVGTTVNDESPCIKCLIKIEKKRVSKSAINTGAYKAIYVPLEEVSLYKSKGCIMKRYKNIWGIIHAVMLKPKSYIEEKDMSLKNRVAESKIERYSTLCVPDNTVGEVYTNFN